MQTALSRIWTQVAMSISKYDNHYTTNISFHFIIALNESRVFANGLGEQGSIPGRVITKTQKMVLDATMLNTQHNKVRIKGGYPRGVVVKAMDCGIVVREFVLQLRYYVHFRANTLRKGMNSLILPAMG